jgi:hypothetical protein
MLRLFDCHICMVDTLGTIFANCLPCTDIQEGMHYHFMLTSHGHMWWQRYEVVEVRGLSRLSWTWLDGKTLSIPLSILTRSLASTHRKFASTSIADSNHERADIAYTPIHDMHYSASGR